MKVASLYKIDHRDASNKSYMAIIIPALLDLHIAKYKKAMTDAGLNHKDYFANANFSRGLENDDFIYNKVSVVIQTMPVKKTL